MTVNEKIRESDTIYLNFYQFFAYIPFETDFKIVIDQRTARNGWPFLLTNALAISTCISMMTKLICSFRPHEVHYPHYLDIITDQLVHRYGQRDAISYHAYISEVDRFFGGFDRHPRRPCRSDGRAEQRLLWQAFRLNW